MQLFSEFVMLVFGSLLAFLALTGRFMLPSGLAIWVALGALLVIWGVRVWVRRGQLASPAARALQWVRAVSLVVSGTVMIMLIWMPFWASRPVKAALVNWLPWSVLKMSGLS